MLRQAPWIHLFFVSASLGAIQCERSQTEQFCSKFCHTLGCSDFDIAHCKDQCQEREDAALDVGNTCAKANQTLIECLSTLDCSGANDWWGLKGHDADDPCRAETDEFLVECPDLWFEDPEP